MFLPAWTFLVLPSHERKLAPVPRFRGAPAGFCTLRKFGNRKFPARIWQRLNNFFLMPFNSRNGTHFVYLWRQFLCKYIQKIFWMTNRPNNFVGLQYFLAVFDLGLKLPYVCSKGPQDHSWRHILTHILSIQCETWSFWLRMPFLKLEGLEATADPNGSNSRWRKRKYTRS